MKYSILHINLLIISSLSFDLCKTSKQMQCFLNALKTCTETHTVTHEHRLTSTAFRWVLEEDLSSPVLTAALSGGEEGFLQLLFWLMLLMRYSVLSKWSNLYFPRVLLSPLVRSCTISSVYLFTITQPFSLSLVSTPISHPHAIFYRLPLTPIYWPDFLSCSIYAPSLPFMFHYPTVDCNVPNHQLHPH